MCFHESRTLLPLLPAPPYWLLMYIRLSLRIREAVMPSKPTANSPWSSSRSLFSPCDPVCMDCMMEKLSLFLPMQGETQFFLLFFFPGSLLHGSYRTLLTLLITTYVESQFPVRSPLCHQLNALSNLILALPTKRHIRLHGLRVHSYKMPLPFQMPITGPDSHPCIRLTGYRSEVLTSSSGLINLPELHAELRKRVCAY